MYMNDYPIEGLMNTAMNSIREMIDVNTIIGETINTSSGVSIIPVSKVNFGFAAGGSEFKTGEKKDIEITEKKSSDAEQYVNSRLPFGGGAGAGVSISPVAFIVVQPSGVKMIPIEHSSAIDKLLDLVPDLIDKTISMVEKQTKKIEGDTQTFKYKYDNNLKNSNKEKSNDNLNNGSNNNSNDFSNNNSDVISNNNSDDFSNNNSNNNSNNSSNNNSNEDLNSKTSNKTDTNQISQDNPSKVTKIEAKPYSNRYDENDM